MLKKMKRLNILKLGANNLVCTMNSTIEEGEVPELYLTSHMDTVVPVINVKPIVKDDGYIYSDGTTIRRCR